jgi:hypothetical protein
MEGLASSPRYTILFALAGASDAMMAHDFPMQRPIRGSWVRRYRLCAGQGHQAPQAKSHKSLQYSSLQGFASGVVFKMCDARNRGCVVGKPWRRPSAAPPRYK